MKIQVVKDINEVIKANKEIYKKIQKGDYVKPKPKTLYFTPKTFYSTFTPEKIRLIQALRERNDLSISEIAKKLGRPFESIHRDVRFLEGLGLINVERRQKYRIPTSIKEVNLSI